MQHLQFKIKRFNGFSVSELYKCLQLRSEVFVVEQNCVYQDVDGKDQKALHLFAEYDDEIVAYCRIFGAGDYFDTPSIGRVVVSAAYRDKKWGHLLLQEAIKAITDNYGTASITISAQLYLKKFYEAHGFKQLGEGYLEDDIPHIKMIRK